MGPSSVAALESWLTGIAWPFWRDYGLDRRRGGFHEALDPDTLTCSASFRRLRVLTRQIYVFSNAATLGLQGAPEIVASGLDRLLRQARQPDGGYAWRFDLDGRVIDQRRDLYDHAFVLLALASAAEIMPATHLRREALRLMAWLDAHMRHPAGGYREALPITGERRRQNAHMHLLEATLAAWHAFGDELFLDRADEIVALFLQSFFDPRRGTVPEFFTEELCPLPVGNHVEAGHLAEWIALLDRHRLASSRAGRLIPEGSAPAAAALWRNAGQFGIHPKHGAFVDKLACDGRMLSTGARLWPQTERLKAAALNLHTAPEALDAAIAALAPYLDHPVSGLWHERRMPEGTFLAEPVPASSLYHLTSGILFLSSRAAETAGDAVARTA
jgi:mannose/cellobiose epimerase-like protein (N-acyl-D-glucosamine 2-epimerase family)